MFSSGMKAVMGEEGEYMGEEDMGEEYLFHAIVGCGSVSIFKKCKLLLYNNLCRY